MCVRACQCPACSSPFVHRKLKDDELFSVAIDHDARILTVQGVDYTFELFDHIASGDDRLFRVIKDACGNVTVQFVDVR